MLLFIADEPFFEEERIDLSGQPFQRIQIRVRIAITEPNTSIPPHPLTVLEFVLDTGADYAFVVPQHLRACGIPLAGPSGGVVPLVLADGSIIEGARRDVSLWLYSNMPTLAQQPARIDLNGGVVVLPAAEQENLPTLGMNAMLDAGLELELNFQTRRFSVWVPD